VRIKILKKGVVRMVDFNEQEVFDTLRDKLRTAVVCDSLDAVGAREQGLRAEVRPVYPGAIVVGKAYPVLAVDIYDVSDESFLNLLDVVDRLKPNDVLLIGSSGSMRAALWGDCISTAAQVRGASGLVCDGALRDVGQIADLKFPAFASGIRMLDPAGRIRIIDDGCPVSCGGVLVNPGDIVFGDIDGVVVIPKELVKEVIPLALKRVTDETLFHNRLLKGENVRAANDAVFKIGK
jgi:regulator of RNase E activity RraA